MDLAADQLGSGVHNLFKYSKYYSGQEPEFVEGDVFKIVVPLNDEYSFDYNMVNDGMEYADKVPIKMDGILMDHLSLQQKIIVQFDEKNGQITSHQAEMLLEVKQRRARTILKKMVDQGILE